MRSSRCLERLLVGLAVSAMLLKYAVDRPAAHGSRAYGGTWPSGHTATATVVWGTLARLLPQRRAVDLGLRAGIPLLVGVSVHGGPGASAVRP